MWKECAPLVKIKYNKITLAVFCADGDYITSATNESYTKMREFFLAVFFIVRSYIIKFSVLGWAVGFKTM